MMRVRSLDFEEREFSSTDVGGRLQPGKWYVAKSIIGYFEIHTFKDREGFFLFWRDNRRGENFESFNGACSRADFEYERVIMGEFSARKSGAAV